MSKHTPGPWFVVAEDGADFTAIATKPSIDSKMDLDCEVLGSSEWLRVKPENLQLMAAAPELLDELRKAIQLISDMLVLYTSDTYYPEHVKQSLHRIQEAGGTIHAYAMATRTGRAAIAKATGTQT